MNDTELLRKFDAIRPFEPAELPEVYDRLLAADQFRQVMAYLFPDKTIDELSAGMHSCKTALDFQKAFSYGFLENLLAKASRGCQSDFSAIDNRRNYTFVSNHRDIVLDSAFLSKLLIDNGFDTTCEIAIGDNLLSLPWVKDLARLNKAFIVERGLSLRQTLIASKRLSEYIHFVIGHKKDNVWIAQREGRAKNSDDRTQESVLKMLSMGGDGNQVDNLSALHIVPLSISYEYDPCDYLKAQEFQFKRDIEGWKKSAQDDVLSMYTGIMGYKGRIFYKAAPCIDAWLEENGRTMTKTEFYTAVASHIDENIFSNYMMYPGNYVALDILEGSSACAGHYTEAEKEIFCKYIDGQLAKIQIPNPDMPFLRERMMEMYANPARNYLSTLKNAD